MKVYVIVVTYNGSRWIEKCFGSLANSSIPLKVLAIDNASSDGTPEKIRALFSDVELIETGENLGFGKANNLGLLEAQKHEADYIFLLNQDAWVEPDTIEKLIKISARNSQFGIVSPIHMNGAGSALDVAFSHYISPATCAGLLSDFVTHSLTDIYETSFVNAAAWLITKDCLNVVGGFDPIFPHYGEDVDYANRCLFHGFKVGVVPAAIIYHDRDYKPTNLHELDANRLYVYNLTVLKSYPGSFWFNFATFIVNQISLFTLLSIFRDFPKLNARFKSLVKTLNQIIRIKRSKSVYAKKHAPILISESN